MNIIHFFSGRCNPDTAGGTEKTAYNLAINQANAGHRTRIIQITAKPVIPISGVEVINYAPACLPWVLPKALWADLQANRPDMVHFHSMYVPLNAALARQLWEAGIPYVVTPNGNCSRQLLKRRPWLKIPYKVLFERPYLNRAAFVQSVGDTEEILNYGVRSPIVLAPNGIDMNSVPHSGCSNPILEKRPDWAGRTLFVFVGRLDTEQKGLDLLLHGAREAADAGGKFGIVLVGPDYKGRLSGLKKLVETLNLQDEVLFSGPAYGTEKYDYIHSGDFFVHTSRWEGMSFSVVEALACGKPCLVTRQADPCGFIEKYGCGCISKTDSNSISKSILELAAKSRKEKDSMSDIAVTLVRNELDWRKIADTVTDAYKNNKR